MAALAAVFLGATGCKLSCNGARRVNDQEQRFAAYNDIQVAAPKTLPTGQRPLARQPVDFEQPAGSGLVKSQANERTVPGWRVGSFASRPTIETHESNASPRSMGLLGLYGLILHSGSRRSGPLDGAAGLRQITFSTEGGDFDPAVDPTGTLLVHASTRHRQTANIYLSLIDDIAITQLTDDPANEVMPAFSPDGKQIAYASDRAGNWDIYIMQVSGWHAIMITDDPSHDIHPSFSPDGKKLVYRSFGQQSGQWELVVVDVENPTTKRFIGFGLFPNWSPTDHCIVFQHARERGTRWFSIWTLSVHDGEASQPMEIAASSNAAAITPCWSRDGKSIVFCTVVDPEKQDPSRPVQADVWITSVQDQVRANLTNSNYASLQPVWSPNGEILFVTDRANKGVDNIWSIHPDQPLQVTQPTELQIDPTAIGPETTTALPSSLPTSTYGAVGTPMAATEGLPWEVGSRIDGSAVASAPPPPYAGVGDAVWTIEELGQMFEPEPEVAADNGASLVRYALNEACT